MFQQAFLGQVRLAQRGEQLTPGHRWWNHHIFNTRALAEGVFAGDSAAAMQAAGELWNAVKNWELITRSSVAGLLIGQHTILAKLLVDCFAAGGKEACVQTAVDALMSNVEAQRAFFPREPEAFAALFGPHTELAGAYITDLAKGDRESFDQHWAQALENGSRLGDFTDQVFFRG